MSTYPKNPWSHSIKVWLSCNGSSIVAHNGANIPASSLRELLEIIAAQHSLICKRWKEFFATTEIGFFC